MRRRSTATSLVQFRDCVACTLVGLPLAGRRVFPLVVTLAGYVALILVWPYGPGRFVWSYFALFAAAAAAATIAITRRARIRPRWRIPRAVAVGISLLALASVVRYDVVGFRHGWHRLAIESNADDLARAVGAIARLTAPTDTIATDVHLSTYLYTGRIVVPTSMLTVAEYLRPKTPAQVRAEFLTIQNAFHPRWWIASGLVPERYALRDWVMDTTSHLRPIAALPNDGLAARAIDR